MTQNMNQNTKTPTPRKRPSRPMVEIRYRSSDGKNRLDFEMSRGFLFIALVVGLLLFAGSYLVALMARLSVHA